MPTPEQIQAIAASMNAHRTDWQIPSLVTFLSRNHAGRSYRALSIAATFVATDPVTTTPALLNNSGPWWAAAAAALPGEGATAVPSASQERCPEEGHEHELAGHCRICAAEKYEPSEPTPLTSWTARDAAWARHLRNPERYPAPDETYTDGRMLAAGEGRE